MSPWLRKFLVFSIACLIWRAISACNLVQVSGDTRFVTFVHGEKDLSLRLRAWQDSKYRKLLISRIFADQWRIIYDVPQECSSAETKTQIEEATRQAIRQWLRPLKEISNRQLVDNFVFTELLTHSNPKDNKFDERERVFTAEDVDKIDPHFRVVFYCNEGRSYAYFWVNEIHMFNQPKQDKSLLIGDTHYSMPTLLHEVGHAFGLADTYVESDENYPRFDIKSGSGLKYTVGKQPLSVMAGLAYTDADPDEDMLLGKDDVEAIRWLYRYFHERNTDVKTCPHEDYELEVIDSSKNISGCRPRYPLIFEIKQGHNKSARWLIKHAFDVEINAQDREGNTALHYAALHGYCDVTRDLLAKSHLYRDATNKDGLTPLNYAEEGGYKRIAALLRGEKGVRCKASKSLCSTIGQEGRTEPLVVLALLLLPALLCAIERYIYRWQRASS